MLMIEVLGETEMWLPSRRKIDLGLEASVKRSFNHAKLETVLPDVKQLKEILTMGNHFQRSSSFLHLLYQFS